MPIEDIMTAASLDNHRIQDNIAFSDLYHKTGLYKS
jgi:hypothetical protein